MITSTGKIGIINIYNLRQFHLLQSKHLNIGGDKLPRTSEMTFEYFDCEGEIDIRCTKCIYIFPTLPVKFRGLM